nr:15736_t:CDS:2 [Entrophospora candida]
MANVHTLQDINSKGYRLGSMREKELEEKLNFAINSIDETNDLSKKLLDKYSDQEKSFNRERKAWSLERKDLNRELIQNNNELQNLRTQALEFANIDKQLRSENTNLISRNTQKDSYLADSKAEIIAKTNEIILLQGGIKSLNAQNDSSLIKSEFLSLKSKLAELDQTKDELVQTKDELVQTKDELIQTKDEVERLKLEAISHQVELQSDESIVGGNEPQKTFSKVSNILVDNKSSLDTKYPAPEKSLRKYLRENIKMQLRKPEVSATSPEIKIVDDTLQNIEPIKIDVPSGNIPNSSLDKSNSWISVGETEAIPAMTSVLGLPKTNIVYVLLATQ